jgi:hypothetical protein
MPPDIKSDAGVTFVNRNHSLGAQNLGTDVQYSTTYPNHPLFQYLVLASQAE